MRDCLDGERKIKERGEVYLPKPDGFNQRADGGKTEYRNYKTRAKFPAIVSPRSPRRRARPRCQAP
jgi:hypothetical protein